jgi:N-acetylneuraminate epimerase
MNRISLLFLITMTTTTLDSCLAQKPTASSFKWTTLNPIPDPIGFAGSFAGVSNEALIVAGGANFPDGGAPWTGSTKAWSNNIYVLEKPEGQWKLAGELPHTLGYGISINYKNGLVLLGGSNESGHHANAMLLEYSNGKITITALPNLPEPIANSCGVLLGNVIYVMGGITTPDAKTTADNFWALDLADPNKTWKILPPWQGPSRMLSVAGALNGSIYLFSGVELVDGKESI